jgi:hypothetical protein
MNLLTISDGFGDSRACPASWYPDYHKWPEIIQLMTKGLTLCNFSRYGAGNEYIMHCLRENISDQDVILIQWTVPERLDLVLAHSDAEKVAWQQKIAADAVYANNVVSLGDHQIWLSSASELAEIKLYHQTYISKEQHNMRSQIFVDYAKLLLKNKTHGFMLSYFSPYLINSVPDHSNWLWHQAFQGLHEFRYHSKYADLDLNMTQPIPLIHFDFVRQFVQTRFDLPWRSERDISGVENLLYRKYQEALKNRPQ